MGHFWVILCTLGHFCWGVNIASSNSTLPCKSYTHNKIDGGERWCSRRHPGLTPQEVGVFRVVQWLFCILTGWLFVRFIKTLICPLFVLITRAGLSINGKGQMGGMHPGLSFAKTNEPRPLLPMYYLFIVCVFPRRRTTQSSQGKIRAHRECLTHCGRWGTPSNLKPPWRSPWLFDYSLKLLALFEIKVAFT
jgi:hypothetical protein